MSNVFKFPLSVSRGALARKSRASKNGTPEERAAKPDGRTFRCNPLRATFAPISPAVTIVGKMQTAENRDIGALSRFNVDVAKGWLDELRAGSGSARAVAIELDRAAEHLLTQTNIREMIESGS